MKPLRLLGLSSLCAAGLAGLAAEPQANPRYAEVAKQLDRDGDVYFYLNARPFNAFIGQLINQAVLGGKAAAAAGAGDQKEQVLAQIDGMHRMANDILGKVGLNQLGDVGLSSTRLPSGLFRTRFYVGKRNAGDQGLIWLWAGKNGSGLPGVALMPSDTVLAGASRPNAGEVWAQIKKIVAGTPAEEPFQQQIAALKEAGTDVEAILNSIGDEAFFALSMDEKKTMDLPTGDAVPLPSFCMGLRVKDKVLPSLLEKMTEAEGANRAATNLNGTAAFVLLPKPAPPFVAPCWAHVDGWLLAANHPDALSALLQRAKGKGSSLKDNAEFQRYAAGMPKDGFAMSFLSLRLVQVYGRVVAKMAGAQPGTPPQVSGLLAELLGAAGEQMGMLSVSEQTGDGLRTSMHGPFNYAVTAGSSTLAAPAVLAALVIPNFTQAREKAQRARCLDNLRQINSATQQYALENNKMPPSLETLASFFAAGAVPQCPAGGAYALPQTFEGLPTCTHPGHSLEP